MYNIDGLNKKQVALLDKLWNFESLMDVLEFLDTLEGTERKECETLIELLQLAITDADVENCVTFKEANNIIKKFTLGTK